jgi:YVTN family beta-propeller protein
LVYATLTLAAAVLSAAQNWCSPTALATARNGATLYVGCATDARVQVLDSAQGSVVRSISTPGPVTGIALSPDYAKIYITAGNTVLVRPGARSIPAGHGATGPALSPDGKLLYVCNRFDNDVSMSDTSSGRLLKRIPVTREPVSAALTSDGRNLLVANALPAGRSDVSVVAAEISIIDTTQRRVTGTIALPNGSTGLREIRISPDGRRAVVTHLLGRFFVPSTQADRGWIETNAISILDVAGRKRIGTVLLDEIDRGAANPWGIAWSGGGKSLLVTHAGTHEVSIIDWAALEEKLAAATRDPADDLAFLLGIRRRISLAGNGPRAIVIDGNHVWVAGYFSDTIESIDLDAAAPRAKVTLQLSHAEETTVRKGEKLFSDGLLSFQGWLSCASCHGPDARVDGLNWDLLNDGIGNPKNTKSLLLAHRTPPAMSQGVREDAEEAVRAGIRHILFAERPDRDAVALDEYLKSLKPERVGRLSAAAQRGRLLFNDRNVGCAVCHPSGLFTDLKSYDVGVRAATDTGSVFDTPTLVEIWRTAPYLHDGSAATLRDVLTTSNRGDRHGRTSQLTPRQIDDLVAYLRSL